MFCISLLPVSALGQAGPDFYGRLDLGIDLAREDSDSNLSLRNHNSRLGINGSEALELRDYRLTYQLEYEVDPTNPDTFSQRNSYLGLASAWGEVTAGYFDTPLKRAQGDLDLFNDKRGDIGDTITSNDTRESSIMYTTPAEWGPLNARVAYMPYGDAGRSDGQSVTLAYDADGLYSAVALSRNVQGDDGDAARFVTTWQVNDWQVGGLAEVSDSAASASRNGWVLSLSRRIDRWALKFQFGQSDMQRDGGETLNAGVDYHFSDNFRTFGYLVSEDGDGVDTRHYLGVGARLDF